MKKLFLSIVMLIFIILSSGVSTTLADYLTVPDGDFEAIDNWTPGGAYPPTLALTDKDPHSGTYCGNVTGYRDCSVQQDSSATGPMTPGYDYTFSLWVNDSRVNDGMYVRVWWHTSSHGGISHNAGPWTTDSILDSWQEISFTATAPPNAHHVEIIIYLMVFNDGAAKS